MIIAHLIGGLGNQMFQYACALSLAHRHRCPLQVDVAGFATYGLRRYALDKLGITAPVAAADEVRRFRRRARVEAMVPEPVRRLVPLRRHTVLRERSFAFDPRVLEVRGDVLLEGYWQSERYFADIAAAVRSEFRLEPVTASVHAELEAQIAAANAVSIHVRRGDYANDLATRSMYGGCCTADYYARAVAEIVRTVPAPRFFVFSDDPAWVRDNLRLGHPTTVVEQHGDDADCADLRLMSLCRHHIIANSSFSWWGAWLDPKPGKIVVAPRRWFETDSIDTRDLIPQAWVRV